MSSFCKGEANKLENIQLLLEKQNVLLRYLTKYGDSQNLSEFFLNLEKNRKISNESLENKLKTIFRLLDEKKKLVAEDLSKLDVKKFKKEMVELQERIFNIKAEINENIALLNKTEKEITEDVEIIYNCKLEKWGKPIPEKTINIDSSNNKEVKEFSTFVNEIKGPENGTWTPQDHQLFLKVRKKFTDIDIFASSLHKLMPYLSIQEIKQHDMWYRKYLFLKDKQKECIINWRRSKEAIKSVEKPPETEKAAPKPLEQKATENDVQEKLKLWKEEKEARKEQARQFEDLQSFLRKQKREEKRRLNEKMKEVVKVWKELREKEEEIRKTEKKQRENNEKRQKAMLANRKIREYQRTYLDKIKEKRENNRKIEEPRAKTAQNEDRNPNRVFQPTKQWLHRSARKGSMGEDKQFCNVQSIQRLRVPQWRKYSA